MAPWKPKPLAVVKPRPPDVSWTSLTGGVATMRPVSAARRRESSWTGLAPASKPSGPTGRFCEIGELTPTQTSHGALSIRQGNFVVCLSACFDTTVHSLLRSLVRAATYFGGTTRQWLFDNAKVVVLERHGSAARFHPLLVDLARAMRVELRLCAPYRGNEKGKVERTIQYLRHSFFAARRFSSVEDLNQQLADWIERIAHARVVPDDPERRLVRDALVEERTRLLSLPEHRFPTPSFGSFFTLSSPRG